MTIRKSKTKKLAKKKADRYFSEYIRNRDANNGICQCITCGKFGSVKEMDCGHFISRRFQATRYDERNAHAQCKKCNRFQNGNQYEHGKKIDAKYGDGTADDILQKSKMLCKRTKSDFEYIAKEYKNKLQGL
jgi:hypothetical protein